MAAGWFLRKVTVSTVIYLSICRGGLYSLVILNLCITEKNKLLLKFFAFIMISVSRKLLFLIFYRKCFPKLQSTLLERFMMWVCCQYLFFICLLFFYQKNCRFQKQLNYTLNAPGKFKFINTFIKSMWHNNVFVMFILVYVVTTGL